MPGFNTIPASGGGGGSLPNASYVGSINMSTFARSWSQAGVPGTYALYSANQESGFAYFVGSTTTGIPLNRIASVSHSFNRIDIVAPKNDMISLYKIKLKSTTNFSNGIASFPYNSSLTSSVSSIVSSGTYSLPQNSIPLVNALVAGAGGGSGGEHHGGGGGGGGGIIKLTAFPVDTSTSVTVAAAIPSNTASQGGTTYFGQVYALGGGFGASHGQAGGIGANGGGAGGHTNGAGGGGMTQTWSTGLGEEGKPVYLGGNAGGANASTASSSHRRGGGGGGAGGIGSSSSGSSNNSGGEGGPGHGSDLTGTTLAYGYGGGGGSHHGSSAGNSSHAHTTSSHTFGARGGGHQTNFGHGTDHSSPSGSGLIIVRSYQL
jgi:hypothetical protein